MSNKTESLFECLLAILEIRLKSVMPLELYLALH